VIPARGSEREFFNEWKKERERERERRVPPHGCARKLVVLLSQGFVDKRRRKVAAANHSTRDKPRPHESALQPNRKEAREIVAYVIAYAATSILASTCQRQGQSRAHRSRGWKTFSPRSRKLELSSGGRGTKGIRRLEEAIANDIPSLLLRVARDVYR